MSRCPKDLFALLLSKAYRDPPAWIKIGAPLRPHRNTNRLWPLTTRSNIMWRLHINKHFETAPQPRQPSVAPTKPCCDTKTTQLENRNAWVEKSKDCVGAQGGGGEQREGLRNKSFDAGAEQRPFDCSENYMDCDFQGLFALKWCRFWKGPLKWQLFLSFSPRVVQGPRPGPRDTYITGPWQLHTRTHKHTQSCGSKPFVAGSWSTDLPRWWRTIRGQPVKQAVSQLLSASQ